MRAKLGICKTGSQLRKGQFGRLEFKSPNNWPPGCISVQTLYDLDLIAAGKTRHKTHQIDSTCAPPKGSKKYWLGNLSWEGAGGAVASKDTSFCTSLGKFWQ